MARVPARLVLLLVALVLLGGTAQVQKRLPFERGKPALRALWLGTVRPGQLNGLDLRAPLDLVVLAAVPAMILLLGLVSFSSAQSPAFVLIK